MIYLDNTTSAQTVFIPKNEGGCITHTAHSCDECFDEGVAYARSLMETGEFIHNGEYESENGYNHIIVNVSDAANLESKEIVIEQDITVVMPSSGYDGMLSVVVDASEYGQQQYEDGVEDGFENGYSSGYTQGSDDEKAKLGYTGFTLNGEYTKPEGGWSSVTVNVEQSGHTDQELIDSYNSGYTSGHTDGVDEEKAKLSGITIDSNTAITVNSGGFSSITVNVPQTGSSCNIEDYRRISATTNGMYVIEPSSGYDGMARAIVDVNVTQPNLGELDVTTNGTYIAIGYGYDGFSAITVDVPSDYGELYCLYCEDAYWQNLSSDNSNFDWEIYAEPLEGDFVNTVRIKWNAYNQEYYDWIYNTTGCTLDERGTSRSKTRSYVLTKQFPNSNIFVMKETNNRYLDCGERYSGSYTEQLIINSTTGSSVRHYVSIGGQTTGSTYYLFTVIDSLNCPYNPAVDENGFGGLRYGTSSTIHFPTSGYAWPVYRKKVNGVWKYRIVKQIVL